MAPPLKNRLRRFQKTITQIIILSSVFCLLFSFAFAQAPKYIRVAIAQDADSLGLSVAGFYRIIDSDTRKVMRSGKHLKTTVIPAKEGILADGVAHGVNKLFIEADAPGAIAINNRKYGGKIEFIKKTDLRLSAVNYIGLEDYVKGILYHEVSHYWPDEALKAQAVVCRTYALYQAGQNASRDYDVTSDIYSQVYGGRASERYRTTRAVTETAGFALNYRGKIFPAYFHATCAGHTEDASLLWNIDLAPLKGVICDFCRGSPHFKWHTVLSRSEIREKLKKSGYALNDIKEIKIQGKDASSRVTKLSITTGNKDISVSGKDFREAIGPNVIKSANFEVSLVNDDIIFEGFGWGHGAGLCQWGAYFMAKQGSDYKQILEYYYPGSEIVIETPRFRVGN